MAGLASAGGASGAVRAGRAYVEAFLDATKLNRDLAQMEARLKKVGSVMTGVGANLALGGGLAMVPVAATFIGFDDAMRLVKATAQATDEEFATLTDTARELGRTTSYTATQVANLMVELARAGYGKPKQLEAMTVAVLDLARATGTDATLAATFMAATLKQFSLGAGDATRVADGLTQAANSSLNSVEDLGFVLQYAGTVAHQTGMSLEDTLAILATLGEMNIRGEMAGTTLRRMISLTGAEAAKFQEVFGVAAVDKFDNVRPMVDLLDDMHHSMVGLGTATKTAKLNEFFGILGITGASILGAGAKSVRQFKAEILAAGGVSKKTAKEMDAGLGGTWRRLKGAAEDAAIAAGGALVPTLTLVGTIFREAALGISSWIAQNQEAVTRIAPLVLAITAAGVALVVLGVALKVAALGFGVVVLAVGALTGALALMLSPLALFAGLLTTLALLMKKDFPETFRAGSDAAAESWDAMVERIKASDLADTFRAVGAIAVESWNSIAESIKLGDMEGALAVAAAGMKAIWAELMFFMTERWLGFKSTIVEGWETAVNTLRELLGDLHDAAVGAWDAVIDEVKGVEGVAAEKGPKVGDVARAEIAREKEERKRLLDADKKAAADELKAARDKFKAALEEAAGRRAVIEATAAALAAMKAMDVKPPAVGAEGPARLERAPMPRKLPDQGAFDHVKGAFAVPAARQQFGFGDTFKKRELDAAEKTAVNTGKIVAGVAGLALALRFK